MVRNLRAIFLEALGDYDGLVLSMELSGNRCCRSGARPLPEREGDIEARTFASRAPPPPLFPRASSAPAPTRPPLSPTRRCITWCVTYWWRLRCYGIFIELCFVIEVFFGRVVAICNGGPTDAVVHAPRSVRAADSRPVLLCGNAGLVHARSLPAATGRTPRSSPVARSAGGSTWPCSTSSTRCVLASLSLRQPSARRGSSARSPRHPAFAPLDHAAPPPSRTSRTHTATIAAAAPARFVAANHSLALPRERLPSRQRHGSATGHVPR